MNQEHEAEVRSNVCCCCIPKQLCVVITTMVFSVLFAMLCMNEGRETLASVVTKASSYGATVKFRAIPEEPFDKKYKNRVRSDIRVRKAHEMPARVLNFKTTAQMVQFTQENKELINRMREFMRDNNETCLPMHAFLDKKNPDKAYNFVLLSRTKSPMENKFMLEYNVGNKNTNGRVAKSHSKKNNTRIETVTTNVFSFGLLFGGVAKIEDEEEEEDSEPLWTMAIFNSEIVGNSERKVKTNEQSTLCASSVTRTRNESIAIRYSALIGDWSENPKAYVMDYILDGEEGACLQKVREEMNKPRDMFTLCNTK